MLLETETGSKFTVAGQSMLVFLGVEKEPTTGRKVNCVPISGRSLMTGTPPPPPHPRPNGQRRKQMWLHLFITPNFSNVYYIPKLDFSAVVYQGGR